MLTTILIVVGALIALAVVVYLWLKERSVFQPIVMWPPLGGGDPAGGADDVRHDDLPVPISGERVVVVSSKPEPNGSDVVDITLKSDDAEVTLSKSGVQLTAMAPTDEVTITRAAATTIAATINVEADSRSTYFTVS